MTVIEHNGPAPTWVPAVPNAAEILQVLHRQMDILERLMKTNVLVQEGTKLTVTE